MRHLIALNMCAKFCVSFHCEAVDEQTDWEVRLCIIVTCTTFKILGQLQARENVWLKKPHCYIEDSLQTEIVAWYMVDYRYYFCTLALSSRNQHRERIE
jgi:hypothetical protein